MELYGSLVANEGGGGGGTPVDVPVKSVSVNGVGVVPVNKNVDITVPTKTSDLENDSDFIDKNSIATTISSDLTNDEVAGAKLVYDELQKLESENKEQFNTAIGDYITVTDSVDGNIIELGIKGGSFQQKYSGKNLLIYPYAQTTKTEKGVSFTDNGDGSILVNRVDSSITETAYFQPTYRLGDSPSNLYLENGDYTIYCFGGDENCYLEIFATKSDNNEIVRLGDTKNGGILNFTINNSDYANNGQLGITFYVKSEATVSNRTFKFMICKGTLDNTETYEPYVGGVPSPNPSYPQPINSVGDNGGIVVKSRGRNLIPYPYYNGADTRNGITATVNSNDGSINLKGTATDKYFFVLLHRNYNGKGFAKQFRGKTITISGGKSSPVLSLAIYDEEGNNITPPNNEMLYDFGGNVTITVPDNACDMYSYYYCSSGAVLNTTLKPQLEVGEVANEYEPFRGSNITIPLSEPLRSVGDVKDEITYLDGKWGILRRIKHITANELNWHPYNDYVFGDGFTSDILPGAGTKASCNIAKANYPMRDNVAEFCFTSITSASNCHLNIRDTVSFPTISEWNAYIASNDVYFDYVLATPVFEPFADQSLPYQIATYDVVTNISNDAEVSAEMVVKYPTTDASGVVSKNEAKLLELESNKVDKCSIPDVPYTLADIYSTDIVGGSIAYTIKNGICSIAITALDTAKTGDLLVTETTFPNPVLDGAMYPVIETETGQVIGNAYIELGKLHVDITANASVAYATLVYIVKE